jgi:thymidylate kinase
MTTTTVILDTAPENALKRITQLKQAWSNARARRDERLLKKQDVKSLNHRIEALGWAVSQLCRMYKVNPSDIEEREKKFSAPK